MSSQSNNNPPTSSNGEPGNNNPQPGTSNTMEEDVLSANKRAALAGQWRTPPIPTYASGYAPAGQPQGRGSSTAVAPAPPPRRQQEQQQQPAPSDITVPSTLPDNSEDYAKALQEAYRKGAEAAARMAQRHAQQQPQSQEPQPPLATSTIPAAVSGADLSATTTPVPTTTFTPGGIPDPLGNASGASTAVSSAMPPPQPVYTTIHGQLQQQQPIQQPLQYSLQQQQQQAPPHYTAAAAPQPALAPPPMPPQPVYTQHTPTASPLPPHPTTTQMVGSPFPAPPSTTSSGIVMATTSTVKPAPLPPLPAAAAPPPLAAAAPGRSFSMPDMTAYSARAEEDKRQKRLARNRASARLRRLRKKNLVDAYETEVGILEKTLKQLQAHEWGKDDDHKALLEALGMERGQQAIAPEQRTEIIQGILQQQMQQIQLLRQAQMEQEFLALVASEGSEDDEMARELQEILQLSDDQKSQLCQSSQGLDKEVEALETVAASLQAMHDNEWLVNDGVHKMTDQFTSILHKNQQSKFLLWTDANAEAIDQLDHVQVQPLQSAPIFTFGVETGPTDDDDGK